MRILIAEDDVVSARVAQNIVAKLGHEPVMARDGGHAWELYQRSPAAIILTDWSMPNLDGLELARNIRANQKTEYSYIILVTAAYTKKENYRAAMDAGVDDFLVKPYEPEDLVIRLRVAERIISFHRQVQELRQLLPICSYCKSIRNDQDYWETIEKYFHDHAGADFSHGICPQCYRKHVEPELEKLRNEKGKA